MLEHFADITKPTAIVYAVEYQGGTTYCVNQLKVVRELVCPVGASFTGDPQSFIDKIKDLRGHGFTIETDLSDEVLNQEGERDLSQSGVRVLSPGRVEARGGDSRSRVYRTLSPLEVFALKA